MKSKRLKVAIVDTWIPASDEMSAEMKKYYQQITVESHSVLTRNQQEVRKGNENSHGSAYALWFITRPVWDCDVNVIECLDHTGRGSFEKWMDALRLCLKIKPHIIWASLGFKTLRNSQVAALTDYTNKLLKENIVLGASSGNNALDPLTGEVNRDSVCYPAKIPGWFAVGSSENGKRNWFSSLGKQLDFTMDGNEEWAFGIHGKESCTGTSVAKVGGIFARLIQESLKFPFEIENRREWLAGMLPFLCHRKRSNKWAMTDYDEEGAWGSLNPLYNSLCTSFDLYKEDNVAGTLKVTGKLKAGV